MIRKIRVWDKKLKSMAKVLNIDFENEIVQCLIQANFDDIELMQSTGLFDKNGVEIFEGDVVKNINTGSIGYFDNNCSFDDLDMYRSKYNLEVIGNIYENKELLKDEQLL